MDTKRCPTCGGQLRERELGDAAQQGAVDYMYECRGCGKQWDEALIQSRSKAQPAE